MELKISYDPAIDAWTMVHKDVHLATEADVAQWQRLLVPELTRLGGKPVWLLVDVSHFEVSATRMEEYGRTIASLRHHFLGVFRYGAGEKTARAVVLQSLVNRYQPNLYRDREEAIRALNQARAPTAGQAASRTRGR